MNKKAFLCSFAFIVSFLLMSCGSLWKVQEGASIALDINLQEILGNDANGTRASSSGVRTIDDDDDDEMRFTVTLTNAKTGREIARRVKPLTSSDQTITIREEFGSIPMYSTLYATVFIEERYEEGDDDFVEAWTLTFRSRSVDTYIGKKRVEIVTYPNAVFLDYERGAEQNTSQGAGVTALNPLTRFNDAIALLKRAGTFLPGATIYLMQSVDVYNDDAHLGTKANNGGRLLSLEGVTIKRHSTDFPFFSIEDGNSLTLSGATLEGDERAREPLISVSDSNSTLILTGNAVLQNNINIGYGDSNTAGIDVLGGAKLIMQNSTIQNNMVYIPRSAAGIYIEEGSVLQLQGSNVSIINNITDDRIGANVVYSPHGIDDVSSFPVQVTGALSSSSKIGLSPTLEGSGTVIGVMANGGTVHANNFFSDEGFATSVVNGHLEITLPKNIYLGGTATDTSAQAGTESNPVQTFAEAMALFNARDKIFITGKITITGTEEWVPSKSLDVKISTPLENGDGNPIPALTHMISVEDGASLTIGNIIVNIPVDNSDAVINVYGDLHIKENVLFENNPFGQNASSWSKASVQLFELGTLTLYGGYIHIGNGIRYELPGDGQTSPISVEGTLAEGSSIWLLLTDQPANGTVLVEKGVNGTINPGDFYIPALEAWGPESGNSNDTQTGDELNESGNLVYLELQDTVYIDGSIGDDTKYGGSGDPVKTLSRAKQLVKGGGSIYVMDTIEINDTFVWDSTKNITLDRYTNPTNSDDSFFGSLISIGLSGNVTFNSGGSSLTLDGSLTGAVALAPLITVNGGNLTFEAGHNIRLENNNNTNGAGAILVNGGHVTIGNRSSTSSNREPVIRNNTSRDTVGAITVQSGGVLTLAGAYITGNNGGGVHAASDGTVVLSGVTSVKGNLASAAKNISYDTPDESGFGVYIGGALDDKFDDDYADIEDIIGITPPAGATTGDVVVGKLATSGYHPGTNDFIKIFHDDGTTHFIADDVEGTLSMP